MRKLNKYELIEFITDKASELIIKSNGLENDKVLLDQARILLDLCNDIRKEFE